jgi:hypothetical protein
MRCDDVHRIGQLFRIIAPLLTDGGELSMRDNIRSISDVLIDARDALHIDREYLSVSYIIELFHERGFGFLLFLFALPAALPLPGLGVNLIVAAPLLVLTVQQAAGRHSVWLPKRIRETDVSRQRFVGFLTAAEPFLSRIEVLIAPRLGWVTQGLFSNLIGACGVLMALSILVPLPLTNTVPAMGIALMALGVLMRDGLAVIAGMMLGLLWIGLLVFVVVTLGVEGVDAIKAFVKDMI